MRLFGIAICYDFHRPHNVRKQDSDLLSFAFEIALRGQNALSQMFRSIVVRGQEPVGRAMLSLQSDRVGALRAELRARQNQVCTFRAMVHQRSGALLAESRARSVLVLTLRTLHLICQLGAVTGSVIYCGQQRATTNKSEPEWLVPHLRKFGQARRPSRASC